MTSMPDRIGRYHILSQIGVSGTTALYRAWDQQLDALVAIKMLVRGDGDASERFRARARAVGRLRHPHIATIYDIGEYQGRPFLAMEHVDGRTLGDLIRGGPLPLLRTLRLMNDLCDGLAFAHRSGVAHGDVDPAHVMVHLNDVLKILGFSVAAAGGKAPLDRHRDIVAVGAVFKALISDEPGTGPAAADVGEIVERCLHASTDRGFRDLESVHEEIRRVSATLPDAGDEEDVRASRWMPRVIKWRKPASALEPAPPVNQVSEPAPRAMNDMETISERARRMFAAGDYDASIAACEEMLLDDPSSPEAFELLDRARVALDERQANELLNQAEAQLQRDAPTAAGEFIARAATLTPTLARVAELRRSVDHALARRERDRQRAETVWQLVQRGETFVDRGSWHEALGAANEALAHDGESAEARLLKLRAQDAIEAEQRAELERRVRDTIRESKRLFAAGSHEDAVDLLARFEPAHDRISEAHEELRAAAERIAEERRTAERLARQQRIDDAILSAREEIARERFADARARLQALANAEGESPEIDAAMAALDAAEAEAERKARLQRELAGHIARAAGLLARNELPAALSRIEAALTIDPKHVPATALKAKIEEATRVAAQRTEAEQRLARERDARIAQAIELAQQSGSHTIAIASLNEVLERDPTHAVALQLMAQRRAAQARDHAEKQRRLETERARREESERQAAAAPEPEVASVVPEVASAAEEPAPQDVLSSFSEEAATTADDRAPLPEERQPATSWPERDNSFSLLRFSEERETSTEDANATGSRRRLPDPQRLITIAIVGLAGLAGLLYLTMSGTDPSRAPQARAATPPPELQRVSNAGVVVPDAQRGISRRVAETQTRAEQAFARGDWQQGLSAIQEALQLRPGDIALEDVLADALRDARERMLAAREAAQRAGAAGSPTFRDAEEKRRDADRLVRAGHSDQAIRALWEGIQLLEGLSARGPR